MSTRRRSMRAKDGKFGRHSVRRHSIRRPSVVSFDGQDDGDDEDFMQIYKEEEEVSSEEEIFENIKLQKEIIESMRTQPWKIRKKLQVLKLAKDYVEKHEGRLSRSHGYQEKGAKVIRRLKREIMNFIAIFIPWEMRVKKIESHYGSVVASYFVFLRWLVWTNIWLALLPIGFIMIPEIIAGEEYGSIDRKTIPDHALDEAYNLKTVWDTEGVVKYSMLFIGYYGNDEVIGAGYRLPLAYFLTGIGSFAFSFIMVLRQMASNARLSRLSSKDEQFTFSWKLYTSWDYMIGNPETSNQKFASIATTFRESILEEKEKTKKENKKLTIFLRVIANILVCISLGLSTWAIQICVDRSRENDIKKRREQYVPTFWEENEVTVIMTSITTLFPSLFDLIALMEKYHPRVNLRWQLGRIFVLNLLNIYTLFIALFWKQQDLTKEIERQLRNATTVEIRNVTYQCPLNLTSSVVTTTTDAVLHFYNNSLLSSTLANSVFDNTTNTTQYENCTRLETHNVTQQIDSDLCWETIIGQEVVKLTILDLVFTAGNVIIVDFLRGLCVRYTNICCCWDLEKQFPEYGEFKTAENILHLINNQGMIWLGTFFCPGLPLMNLLKLLMLLYMRNWAVMVCNVPQDRIFRASRSNNFYYAMLLCMLFLCTLPVAFAMVLMKPSPNCGPFSGLDFMMDVITNTMEKELSSEVNTVLDYIASPAVIIPLFLLLSLGIYYLVALSRALREANNDLKMQLEYERTDGRKKVYAMAAIRDGNGNDQDGANGQRPGENGGKGGKSGKRMAGAVASVLAATRMARLMTSNSTPPVAVVKGKPSYPRRVPPAVAPRPRGQIPGNPQHARPSLQNITSQLMRSQNAANTPVEPRGRRNLRELAGRARSQTANEARESDNSPGEATRRGPNRSRPNPQRQSVGSNDVQRQQQQRSINRPRQRNPKTQNREINEEGRQRVEMEPEDEFSRYAPEDEQQRQSLLGISQSEDSGINVEGNELDPETSQPAEFSRRHRRFLSVEGESEEEDDEDDEEENDETEDFEPHTVTFVDETESRDHRRRNEFRGPARTLEDPSSHTNAVYEEDFDSDEDFEESPEGTLSASGHLIPRIKVTDFSDNISSNSDVVAETGSNSTLRDQSPEQQGPSGTGRSRTNWQQRQRDPSTIEATSAGPATDTPAKPTGKSGLFRAVARFQKAGRDKKRSNDPPGV